MDICPKDHLLGVPFFEQMSEKKTLNPIQTSFRTKNSTETALLKVTQDIRIGIDNKLITFILIFDFSNAFDNIPSSRLLAKLRLMGISRTELLWMRS